MTVRELIEALTEMPPDDDAMTLDELGFPRPVRRIVHESSHGDNYVAID